MQKDHLARLNQAAETFGVVNSIKAGLLNYKTIAHVIRQAVKMEPEQFRVDILDKLYAGISRDDFPFIESLYKMNNYANGEESIQRTTFINSLLRTCERIEKDLLDDEDLDNFVMLSPFSNHGWVERLSDKKPKVNSSNINFRQFAQRVEPQAEEEPEQERDQARRRRGRGLFGLVILSELLATEHDPDCPFHHGPHGHDEEDDHEHGEAPNCFVQ